MLATNYVTAIKVISAASLMCWKLGVGTDLTCCVADVLEMGREDGFDAMSWVSTAETWPYLFSIIYIMLNRIPKNTLPPRFNTNAATYRLSLTAYHYKALPLHFTPI